MNDPAPLSRLDQLRFARRVVVQQSERALAEIDRWITDEERREAERARGAAARPPAPAWLIEGGSGRPAIYVHEGGCHMAGKHTRGLTADQARQVLVEGQATACPHCRPDTLLGVLD
ncbi:DUF6233 domain-containing protein [Streptomyces sp. NPDC002564]|uniref:DUF6233 domain-containing protein n=1 Tax=Streptomyces sp. NPDC002564 TaxID=3364649 RepID=UPI0036A4F6EC